MLITGKSTTNSQNSNTTNSNSVVGGVIPQDNLGDGIQQEAKWFNRKNDLVAEFYGEEPIVYESDMTTIKKENQYGYIPKPGELVYQEPDELLEDDVDLMVNIDRVKPLRTNADYIQASEDFESKWAEIKRKVREDDNFDGVIKGEEEEATGEDALTKYEKEWINKNSGNFIDYKNEDNNPTTTS